MYFFNCKEAKILKFIKQNKISKSIKNKLNYNLTIYTNKQIIQCYFPL